MTHSFPTRRASQRASTRTDDNGPQYLLSRTNDRAIANGGVPLARDSVRRVRSAQGHALINGDIVPDLRRFPYDGKAMINKKVTTDLRPRKSEESRVGKACVSKCRCRWSPYH